MKSAQIAVRLSAEELQRLDELVRTGRFASRADAIRAGIAALAANEIDAQIVEAYRRQPQEDWELELAERSARAMIAAEPW